MPVAPTEHTAALTAFTGAATNGDYAGLLTVLDPNVTLTSDGGGQVTAARRPVIGADRVARFLIGIARRPSADQRLMPLLVNATPGLAVFQGPHRLAVAALTVEQGKVLRLDLILAPDKIEHVQQDLGRRASPLHPPAVS